MSRLHNNLITINWCSAGSSSSADRPVGPSGEIERKQRIWSPASTDGCYILHTLLCTLAYCREEATDRDVPLTRPKQMPKCLQFMTLVYLIRFSVVQIMIMMNLVDTFRLWFWLCQGNIFKKEIIFSFFYH